MSWIEIWANRTWSTLSRFTSEERRLRILSTVRKIAEIPHRSRVPVPGIVEQWLFELEEWAIAQTPCDADLQEPAAVAAEQDARKHTQPETDTTAAHKKQHYTGTISHVDTVCAADADSAKPSNKKKSTKRPRASRKTPNV
jgi:putative N-acetylmannosamine-6-phosphate epimerase